MIGRISAILLAIIVYSTLGWQGLVGMLVGGAIFQIAYKIETGYWFE